MGSLSHDMHATFSLEEIYPVPAKGTFTYHQPTITESLPKTNVNRNSSIKILMKFHTLCIHILFCITLSSSKSDISIGYQLILAIPMVYIEGFIGKAFIMEIDEKPPNFRAGVSIEAFNGRYSCSINVFLGSVKVWDSSHSSKLFTTDECILELTKDGDLHLKGSDERVGWQTGTSGQGVEKLKLLETGNLVLVDAAERIMWQTFNFPTDVLLMGQRLSVATRLTSYPSTATFFYSLEIQHEKIVLYWNSGEPKYSYWEFKPSKGRNITFVELTSRGLELFDDNFERFAQITSTMSAPIRFLRLLNTTGNIGLYYYAPDNNSFEASFRALNETCDLPLACNPYEICTRSDTCSCISSLPKEHNTTSDCIHGIKNSLCGKHQAEMLELNSITNVLTSSASTITNITKQACATLCLNNCTCSAALYISSKGDPLETQQCTFYDIVQGAKQVETGSGFSYMVKMPKGTGGVYPRTHLRKWVVNLVIVADIAIFALVLGGVGYYMIWKRRKN
ncbi:hypothetical protein Drorol1_Dr00026403 [Drosera rotundifolia]